MGYANEFEFNEMDAREREREDRVGDIKAARLARTAAFTPGPWIASPAGKNWWITTAKGLEETISCMAGTDPEGWPREANARLIAAAPEMLLALEAARERLRGMQEDVILDQIHAAIQKAKGGL